MTSVASLCLQVFNDLLDEVLGFFGMVIVVALPIVILEPEDCCVFVLEPLDVVLQFTCEIKHCLFGSARQ